MNNTVKGRREKRARESRVRLSSAGSPSQSLFYRFGKREREERNFCLRKMVQLCKHGQCWGNTYAKKNFAVIHSAKLFITANNEGMTQEISSFFLFKIDLSEKVKRSILLSGYQTDISCPYDLMS